MENVFQCIIYNVVIDLSAAGVRSEVEVILLEKILSKFFVVNCVSHYIAIFEIVENYGSSEKIVEELVL